MSATINQKLRQLAKAVIRVGGGRGFIVERLEPPRFIVERLKPFRIIITAAHCLPHLPPAHPMPNVQDVTYQNLLGPLGKELTVWAQCLFVDPLADIAVLGCPDYQALYEEAGAFDALTEKVSPIPVGPVLDNEGAAWLLMFDGHWSSCTLKEWDRGALQIKDAKEGIHEGMSGSPIIDSQGRAVGLVSISSGGRDVTHTNSDRNPSLVGNLPGWLLPQLRLPPQGTDKSAIAADHNPAKRDE